LGNAQGTITPTITCLAEGHIHLHLIQFDALRVGSRECIDGRWPNG
jgi:hypothetical protein